MPSAIDLREILPGLIRLRFVVPGPPVAAPRQTGRSKYNPKKRPAIERYHTYRDAIRLFGPRELPPAGRVERVEVEAYWQPPASWSQRRRSAAIGIRKRTKPDPDNVLKSVLDALWPNDEALGDCEVSRWYGRRAETVIEITYYAETSP